MKFQKLILLMVFPICFSGKAPESKEIKLLFVGNSLTYVNDLPGLVAGLGKQDGVSITYKTYLFPDYSLEDHWNEGKVQAEIEGGGFDFVIAQQGPSALAGSQLLLLEYAKRFEAICTKGRTKLALYMVWPSKARYFDLDNVISSYTNAASKTSSVLCPAGKAWKLAWQSDSLLSLYSFDNFHPSMTGSVLAALTVYGSIMQKDNFDFINYGNCPWNDVVSKRTFTILSHAALKAINK
jgi:hypothetical protein